MQNEPRCQLCSGSLVREKHVTIQAGGTNAINWSLAWVCKECSTAWPIATGKGGVIRSPKPLYENGERMA